MGYQGTKIAKVAAKTSPPGSATATTRASTADPVRAEARSAAAYAYCTSLSSLEAGANESAFHCFA